MKTLILSALLFTLSSAYACSEGEVSFPQTKACATVSWLVGPSFNQFNSVSVHLTQTDLKLNALPWMVMDGGHEHGSRPVVVTNVSNQDYLIEKIYFMGGMMGEWFLKLQLQDENKKVIEEIRLPVKL